MQKRLNACVFTNKERFNLRFLRFRTERSGTQLELDRLLDELLDEMPEKLEGKPDEEIEKPKRKRANLFITDEEAGIIYREAALYTPDMEIMIGLGMFRGWRIEEIRHPNQSDFTTP